MGPQFFETMIGRRFFERQLPDLTKAINRLADAKEAENARCQTIANNEHEITEICPHCEREIVMHWDVKKDGFKAFCPHCGKCLMLCCECLHADGANGEVRHCDYNEKTNTCKQSV